MLENIKEVDESDFERWLEHPITKMLFKDVIDKIKGAENYVLNNINYGEDGVHYSFYMKGGMAVYKDLINYSFSAFDELRKLEVENDQTDRYNSSS